MLWQFKVKLLNLITHLELIDIRLPVLEEPVLETYTIFCMCLSYIKMYAIH